MRNHNQLFHNENYNGDSESCRKECEFTSQINLTDNTTHVDHTFICCTWRRCEASSGGGIFYQNNNPEASLTITYGQFFACIATDARGGGIFAEGLKTFTVHNALFSCCSAGGSPDCGGAGMEIESVTTPPTIESCVFLSCISSNDGGGMGIWHSPSFQQKCIVCCNFIHCEAQHSSSSDGGSLIVWYSNAAIGCSNVLFADSHSERRGGAASFNITGTHNSTIPLFSFCFFKNNKALLNPGNDVNFHDWKPTEPFLHCFSTTKENRISYRFEGDYHTDQDNWPPHGIDEHLRYSNGTTFIRSDMLLLVKSIQC